MKLSMASKIVHIDFCHFLLIYFWICGIFRNFLTASRILLSGGYLVLFCLRHVLFFITCYLFWIRLDITHFFEYSNIDFFLMRLDISKCFAYYMFFGFRLKSCSFLLTSRVFLSEQIRNIVMTHS